MMGSKSKSSSEVKTTTNTDYSYLQGTQGIAVTGGVGAGAHISLTDQGAVAGGLAATESALKTTEGAVKSIVDLGKSTFIESGKVTSKAIDAVRDSNRTMALFSSEAISVLGDHVTRSQATALNMAESATKNAMDFAASAVKSDSAELLQSVSKYAAVVVGVVLVALVAFKTRHA